MDFSQQRLDLIKFVTITRTPEQLLKVLSAQTSQIAANFGLVAPDAQGGSGTTLSGAIDPKTAKALSKTPIDEKESILSTYRASKTKAPLSNMAPNFCGEFGEEKNNGDHDEMHPGKQKAQDLVAIDHFALTKLQEKLYAEGKKSILIVLQALDTGGKDGTIKACLGPLNPQGVTVHGFKKPTKLESSHDFLWRIHDKAPPKGMIAVFNRSHYESVLVEPVHNWITPEQCAERYEAINKWEKGLADAGTEIIKFYLHISPQEQKRRLERRLENPTKHWKFSKNDIPERKLWYKYEEYFNKALTKCNTDYAPWYVIPSDYKWFRNFVVTRILREHLQKLDPQYPEAEEGLDQVVIPDI